VHGFTGRGWQAWEGLGLGLAGLGGAGAGAVRPLSSHTLSRCNSPQALSLGGAVPSPQAALRIEAASRASQRLPSPPATGANRDNVRRTAAATQAAAKRVLMLPSARAPPAGFFLIAVGPGRPHKLAAPRRVYGVTEAAHNC
jgi:hypothetical protein